MAPKQTEEIAALEAYINSLIDKKLEDQDDTIKEKDAEEIVKHLMPEIEKVVAKIVLKHLKAIITVAQRRLKKEG